MNLDRYLPESAYEVGDKMRQQRWKAFNSRTFGASVAVQDESKKLLVLRRNYGNKEELILPGGGLSIVHKIRERLNPIVGKPDDLERYEIAAWRELEEEVGIKRSIVEETGVLAKSYDEQGNSRDLQVIYGGIIRATSITANLPINRKEIQSGRFMHLNHIDINHCHHALAKAVTVLREQVTSTAINN